MAVIRAEIHEDGCGKFITFGVGANESIFRPQASGFAHGPYHAFNKDRKPAETTEFVTDEYTVVPYGSGAERYLVVYTKERRELWCSHGGSCRPTELAWHPYDPLPKNDGYQKFKPDQSMTGAWWRTDWLIVKFTRKGRR